MNYYPAAQCKLPWIFVPMERGVTSQVAGMLLPASQHGENAFCRDFDVAGISILHGKLSC